MHENTLRERSAGLDLLRSLCMLMVVILHLLGRGGVMAAAVPFTPNYHLTWLWESAAYCAVDCYALLTGYLSVRSRFRPAPLLQLWLQVFCYSAGITALFALFYEQVSPLRFLQACLPVTFTQYWYFTAYFALYCFAPFFNRLIAVLSRDAFRRLLITGFILLSVIPTVSGADPFVTGDGYSFLWLAVLYFGGAYLRLYPPRTHGSLRWLGGYGLCVLALLVFRTVMERITFALTGAVAHGGWILTYTSPVVLGAAVCLLLCGRDLQPSAACRRVIAFFTPVSFGVYLFHTQPFVFHRLLNGAAVPLLELPAWLFAIAVPAAAAAIFLTGAAVDHVRRLAFCLLRIPQLTERLGARLERILPEI